MTASPTTTSPGTRRGIDPGATRKLNMIGRIAFWAFVVTAMLAPLPFGANRPWSWSLLSLAIGIVVLIWVASVVLDRGRLSVPLARCWPMVLPFAALVLWALLQESPLLPASWHHPLWAEAARALDTPLAGAVSVNPGATREAIMRLLAYGGAFWLALQFGRNPYRARQLLWAVVVAAFLYAVYGLIDRAAGNDTILWFDKWAYPDSLTSTFVNRNSYATYAGIGLLATFAVMFGRSRNAFQSPFSRFGMRTLMDGFGAGGWVFALMILTVVTALLLTNSRGGFLATLIGTVVLIMSLAAAHRVRTGVALLYAGVFVAGTVVMLAISGTVTLQRIDESATLSNERLRVYRMTADAIADAPLHGTGLGTFRWIFALYRDDTVGRFYDKAHNSYLEFALGAGLPAFAAMVLLMLVIGGYCLRGALTRQRDAIFPALGLAVLALGASHALVDFSLQIPAVTVTFALLLGLGCAQSWRVRTS